jgi:hypothetical protein
MTEAGYFEDAQLLVSEYTFWTIVAERPYPSVHSPMAENQRYRYLEIAEDSGMGYLPSRSREGD